MKNLCNRNWVLAQETNGRKEVSGPFVSSVYFYVLSNNLISNS